MQVDVVLCTFNGERFLAAQLESIARQTRPPDRVLAFDDGSSDGTVAMLHRAAAKLPLMVEVNPHRIGATGNFAQALACANGDVILLCDQDDVWEPTKVERMVGVMQSRPDLLLLGTDARLIDGAGQAAGRLLLDELGGRGAADWGGGEWLQRLLRRNLVTGATLALRRQLLDLALPIPEGYWHDEWLGLLAGALGRIGWVEDALMRYRLHGANAAGLAGIGAAATVRGVESGGRPYFAQRACKLDALMERLGPFARELPAGHLELIEQARMFWRNRAAPAPSRATRWRFALRVWRAGQYHQFADGTKSFARDLLL